MPLEHSSDDIASALENTVLVKTESVSLGTDDGREDPEADDLVGFVPNSPLAVGISLTQARLNDDGSEKILNKQKCIIDKVTVMTLNYRYACKRESDTINHLGHINCND